MSEPHHTHHQGQPVHRITEAQESHAAEQHSRVLKYTISMSVRLACFIAAFFVHGWLQWVFLAAAIVLPYVAVVIANGGADVTKRQPAAEFFAGDDPRLLTSGTRQGTASSVPDLGGNDSAVGEDHAEDATAGSWKGGETYEFEEFNETVTERAATGDGDDSGRSPNGSGSPYPAEAPTTIDGSFVDEPEETGEPTGGHHRHGSTP
jgi:hypothetical protein